MRETQALAIKGHLKECPGTPTSDEMVLIGSYAPAPSLPPFIQAKEMGFISRTDVACLYH